jgi:F-type H+-transporting ATPase subunit epsilon
MTDKLQLKVVTRTRQVIDTEVDEVRLPGALGEIGVLPGHASLLTSLGTGELFYRSNTDQARFAVQDGFAEVNEDVVTILAEVADSPDEIDAEASQSARSEAEEALKTATAEDLEALTKKLRLAEVRLQVAAPAHD